MIELLCAADAGYFIREVSTHIFKRHTFADQAERRQYCAGESELGRAYDFHSSLTADADQRASDVFASQEVGAATQPNYCKNVALKVSVLCWPRLLLP